MVAKNQPDYCYRVDGEDVIVHVDDWWLAFARENGAANLTEKFVLGRLIWDFIIDQPTQLLYQELHDRVRSTKESILVPFRCDSPTLKRYMELNIRPFSGRELLYESRLLKAVPQRWLSTLESDRETSSAFLNMCSVCKRCLIEPAGWLELPDIGLKLRTIEQANPELRYTLCPNCEPSSLGASG